MNNIMSKKILMVFAGLSVVLGLGLAASNKLSLEAWNDQPSYMEDAELELVHSDTVQVQEYRDVCQERREHENGRIECLEYEEEIVGGENVEVIEFEDKDFEYLGNGEALISFDARVNNELVGPINSGRFIDEYMLNGEKPSRERVAAFEDSLQDVSFGSIGGEINAQDVESSNVNAAEQNMEFVVELEEFRYGGISLNEDSGIRLSTGNYNGGGNL